MARRRPVFKTLPTSELVPWEGNPRTISEDGLEKIRASIERFGFAAPVVAQRGTNLVVAGHQRLRAAELAGVTDVPVVLVDLTDDEARAYNVADNRTAEEADWDRDLLAELLRDLDGDLVDAMGFGARELQKLLAEDAPEEPPIDVSDTPTTEPGDIWHLGTHRIPLCRLHRLRRPRPAIRWEAG